VLNYFFHGCTVAGVQEQGEVRYPNTDIATCADFVLVLISRLWPFHVVHVCILVIYRVVLYFYTCTSYKLN
jgi:hypothetical protein